MFAIVEVAGQQFKVEKDVKIFVHRLQDKEGDKIMLDQVLLVEDNGKTLVGTPVVKDYQVKATVVSHLKGDKVKVFKKKRRKGYQKLNGHRQYLTEIHIDGIEKARATAKKTSAAKTEVKETKETKAPKKEAAASRAKAAAPATKTKKTETKTGTAKKTTRTAAAKKETPAKAKSTAARAPKKTAAKKNDDAGKKEEK